MLAGVAFVLAGLLADRRQAGFFAVAAVDFAAAVVILRRGRVRTGGGA